MRKLLAALGLVLLGTSPVFADAFSDQYTGMVTRIPALTPPYQPTDYVSMVRNGIPYKTPILDLPGGGNVTGPNPSVVNEIASYANTIGTLLRQGAARITDSRTGSITTEGAALAGFSETGVSAQLIYNTAVMSASPTLFTTYDAVRGVVSANALSTISNAQGVAGYVLNNTVPIGQNTAGAALSGTAVCAANSTNCWGIVTLTSDNPVGNTGVTAGTGKILINEFDVNVTSPNTEVHGLSIGGTALPVGVTLNGSGLAVTKLWGSGGVGTGTSLWGNGLILQDGCCAIGFNLGTTAATGADVAGMPMFLNYRTHSDTDSAIILTATSAGSGTIGTLILNGLGSNANLLLSSGSYYAPSDNGFNINNHFVLTADASDNISLGSAVGASNIHISSGTGGVIMTGMGSVAAGTGKAFLCIDVVTSVVYIGTGATCV